jgi:hypothetical protein
MDNIYESKLDDLSSGVGRKIRKDKKKTSCSYDLLIN